MHRRSVLASLALSGLGGCLRLASDEESGATDGSTTAGTSGTDEAATSTDATESTTDEAPDLDEPALDWWNVEGEPRSVAVEGDTAYVSGSSDRFEGVTALDVRTGEERWRALEDVGIPFVTPTYADGSLYVGSNEEDSRVLELDAETGRTLAQFDPDIEANFDGILAVTREFVLVTTSRTYDGGQYVYLLDRDDLDPVWERHYPGDERSANPEDGVLVDGAAVLADPNVTFALDLADGSDLWRIDEGSARVERVGDRLVYVHRERVAARPIGERDDEWGVSAPGGKVTLHPDAGVFVVATQEGVRTHDVETGEQAWETPFEDVEYGEGLFDPRRRTGIVDDAVWVWSRETLCGFDVASGVQTTVVSLPIEPERGTLGDGGVVCWATSDYEGVLHGASADPL